MTDVPFMPMFWSDFFSDTELMSNEARGTYALLLGRMWMNHGWLPQDDTLIAKLLRIDVRLWRRLATEISPLLLAEVDPHIGPIYRQKRLVAEWGYANERIAKNKARTARATEERLKKSGKGPHVTNGNPGPRNVARNEARNDGATRGRANPEPQEPPSRGEGGSGPPLPPSTPDPARSLAADGSSLTGPFVPAQRPPPTPARRSAFLDAYEAAQGDLSKLPTHQGAPMLNASNHVDAQSVWDAVNQKFTPARPQEDHHGEERSGERREGDRDEVTRRGPDDDDLDAIIRF